MNEDEHKALYQEIEDATAEVARLKKELAEARQALEETR
jgi:arginine deiminase